MKIHEIPFCGKSNGELRARLAYCIGRANTTNPEALPKLEACVSAAVTALEAEDFGSLPIDLPECGDQNGILRHLLVAAIGRALVSEADRASLLSALTAVASGLSEEANIITSASYSTMDRLKGYRVAVAIQLSNASISAANNVLLPFPSVSGMIGVSVTPPSIGSYVSGTGWVIDTMAAGQSGTVGYNYRINSATPAATMTFTPSVDGVDEDPEVIDIPAVIDWMFTDDVTAPTTSPSATFTQTLEITCDSEELFLTLPAALSPSEEVLGFTWTLNGTSDGTLLPDGFTLDLTQVGGGARSVVLDWEVAATGPWSEDAGYAALLSLTSDGANSPYTSARLIGTLPFIVG